MFLKKNYVFFDRIMTINVIVKCPQGIVMGADSLLSIGSTADGIVSSIIPYNSKLFPIGNFATEGSNYAAGALLNGANSVAGRTVEDILQEFGEDYPKIQTTDDYSLNQMAIDLGDKISKLIRKAGSKGPSLEIILGGYSRGKKAGSRRYGEIYGIFWDKKKNYRLRVLYTKDTEFGTVYGGQPKILDKFRYGMDDWTILKILERREKLFNKVCNYVIKQLHENNINIPKNTRISVPNSLKEFDVFSLFSDYKVGNTAGQTLKNIKTGMAGALQTMEAFFTLQTAINYCCFLMTCAYAESAFTFVIPSVGSEMRVGSITRREGFHFRKSWEIKVPGPPFG